MTNLPLLETFTSVQGEGLSMGRKTFFIRLAGCNLRCHNCDTEYSWITRDVPKVGVEKLINGAKDAKTKEIAITGGEPLLNDLEELCNQLQALNFSILIETNCTIIPKSFGYANFWSVSPKLPSSKQYYKPEVLEAFIKAVPDRMQLKFVVDSKEDYENFSTILHDHKIPPSLPVILQPNGLRYDYVAGLRRLIERTLEDESLAQYNLRILPQLHRVVWGHQRGV